MNFKKIALIFIPLLVIIIGLIALLSRSSTGTLAVETEPTAEVTLIVIKDKQLTKDTLGRGNVKKRLKPGQYTVAATDGQRETRALAEVKAGQTTRLQLELKDLKEAEKLLDGTSYDIVASPDAQSLRFLDRQLQLLYELAPGSEKAEELFFELYPVVKVNWIDYQNAFVVLEDNQYKLIVNNQVRDFIYPDGLQPAGDFVPEIAYYNLNDRGQLVANIENDIYLYESLTAPPRKLYDDAGEDANVALSNDGQVLIYTDTFASSHEETPSTNRLINASGQEQDLSITNATIDQASWGPDQQLLIVIDGEVKLYDTASQNLQPLLQFPPDNITSTRWYNQTTLLFINDGALWSLDITSELSQKLAVLPGKVSHIDALTLARQTLYFGTSPSGRVGSSGSLYQIKLESL